jgi:hypothetical protein
MSKVYVVSHIVKHIRNTACLQFFEKKKMLESNRIFFFWFASLRMFHFLDTDQPPSSQPARWHGLGERGRGWGGGGGGGRSRRTRRGVSRSWRGEGQRQTVQYTNKQSGEWNVAFTSSPLQSHFRLLNSVIRMGFEIPHILWD